MRTYFADQISTGQPATDRKMCGVAQVSLLVSINKAAKAVSENRGTAQPGKKLTLLGVYVNVCRTEIYLTLTSAAL